MNAMEKVAWYKLLVSIAAAVVVTVLLPWLGAQGALAGFALLALLAGSGLFLRKRGTKVVVDERDRGIDYQRIRWGVYAAWMALFLPLLVLTLWSNQTNRPISTLLLTWLLWVDIAILTGVRGLVGVILYRRQSRAAYA